MSLGRREDLLRIDDIQFVELNEYEIDSDAEDDEEDEDIPKKEKYNLKHSIYIPKTYDVEFDGISYRLNNYYKSTRDKWEKIDVKFIQKGANFDSYNILLDEKEDVVYFNNL